MKEQIENYLKDINFESNYWTYDNTINSYYEIVIRFKHLSKGAYMYLIIKFVDDECLVIIRICKYINTLKDYTEYLDFRPKTSYKSFEEFKQGFSIFLDYIKNKDYKSTEELLEEEKNKSCDIK